MNWKEIQIRSHNKIIWKSTLGKNWPSNFVGFFLLDILAQGLPSQLSGEESTCPCRRCKRLGGSVPGSGRSRGEGDGNPHQHSLLGNLLDRGAWHAIVHGVTRVRHDLVTKPAPPPNLHMCEAIQAFPMSPPLVHSPRM